MRKQIGYMPDFFGVYDQLKANEYLDFYGASYGIPEAEREVLIPQLLELVNLTHKRYEYVDLIITRNEATIMFGTSAYS